MDLWLIIFYVVGFVLAICLSIGSYVYAKRALQDLRARALAREQVLYKLSKWDSDGSDGQKECLLLGLVS